MEAVFCAILSFTNRFIIVLWADFISNNNSTYDHKRDITEDCKYLQFPFL